MASFTNPTLIYWNCKARNYHTLVVAKAGGVHLDYKTDFDMATLKPTLPFGQLPYLVDGDVKIAQSNAIFRYIAKKANLQGDSVEAFADSEMLTEEATDIYNLIVKAFYAADRVKSMNEFFAAGSALHVQLGYLEKKHPGDGPYFKNTPGVRRVAGAYAIACVLDILVHLESTVLDAHPKLKGFYTAMLALPCYDGYKDLPMYFNRNA